MMLQWFRFFECVVIFQSIVCMDVAPIFVCSTVSVAFVIRFSGSIVVLVVCGRDGKFSRDKTSLGRFRRRHGRWQFRWFRCKFLLHNFSLQKLVGLAHRAHAFRACWTTKFSRPRMGRIVCHDAVGTKGPFHAPGFRFEIGNVVVGVGRKYHCLVDEAVLIILSGGCTVGSALCVVRFLLLFEEISCVQKVERKTYRPHNQQYAEKQCGFGTSITGITSGWIFVGGAPISVVSTRRSSVVAADVDGRRLVAVKITPVFVKAVYCWPVIVGLAIGRKVNLVDVSRFRSARRLVLEILKIDNPPPHEARKVLGRPIFRIDTNGVHKFWSLSIGWFGFVDGIAVKDFVSFVARSVIWEKGSAVFVSYGGSPAGIDDIEAFADKLIISANVLV
mmetsp:Transcript_11087/g.28104  ORF Transcript_11087/g.28104 Transcript_11087/m.28104 type:complete len:389 (-) Transcript_11087:470-1636(-)